LQRILRVAAEHPGYSLLRADHTRAACGYENCAPAQGNSFLLSQFVPLVSMSCDSVGGGHCCWNAL
jgi:hypothetical protein